jgi:DNA processing protein
MNPDFLTELLALLRLRFLPGVGDRTAGRLLDHFGSAVAALEAEHEGFVRIAGREAGRARETGTCELDAEKVLERAGRLGMAIVGRGLPGYPVALLQLVDPPPVLFLRGRLETLDRPALTVVGSRKATSAGRRFAGELGEVLSAAGVAVASGLALGIDAAAHRGALGGPGATIGVLASGLDEVHPRSHRRLQERIAGEGLLVSEFPPGEEVRPHHFPRRNRILAALGRAVVVVEAGARSGALITVDHALDLGLRVFSVPGSIEYDQSRGSNALLRDGAECLGEPLDIFRIGDDSSELPLFPDEIRARALGRAAGAVRQDPDDPGQADEAEALTLLLGSDPRSTESLQRSSGLPAVELMRRLSELEMGGVAVRTEGGWRLAARPPLDPGIRRRIPRPGVGRAEPVVPPR